MKDIADKDIRRGSVVAIASTNGEYGFLKYGVVVKVEDNAFRVAPLSKGESAQGQPLGINGKWFTPNDPSGDPRVAVLGTVDL